MIKSLLKLSIALLSFMFILSAASAQGLKVGIVDMNRVFAEYYKTKDADKVVNEQKEAAKKELESINNDYKKLLDSYQKLAKEIKDPAIGEELRKKKGQKHRKLLLKREHWRGKRRNSPIEGRGCCSLKLTVRGKR